MSSLPHLCIIEKLYCTFSIQIFLNSSHSIQDIRQQPKLSKDWNLASVKFCCRIKHNKVFVCFNIISIEILSSILHFQQSYIFIYLWNGIWANLIPCSVKIFMSQIVVYLVILCMTVRRLGDCYLHSLCVNIPIHQKESGSEGVLENLHNCMNSVIHCFHLFYSFNVIICRRKNFLWILDLVQNG